MNIKCDWLKITKVERTETNLNLRWFLNKLVKWNVIVMLYLASFIKGEINHRLSQHL